MLMCLFVCFRGLPRRPCRTPGLAMTTSGHLVQVARQALYPNLPVPNKVATMAVKQVRIPYFSLA